VYTADPRIVPNARKLKEISYDEMLELASLGAKVMQSRSVEFAKKFGVVLAAAHLARIMQRFDGYASVGGVFQ